MSVRTVRIAVDAMGGDHFPDVLVEGSIAALQRFPDVEIALVGDETVVTDCVERNLGSGAGKSSQEVSSETIRRRLRVVHAPDVIDATESPVRAVRSKKNASIVVCNQLCRSGEVDAVIAAGHTGAAMAASLLYMGRLAGVSRPAIMAIFPSENGPVVVLDVGANTDCKPEHLFQFGVMASIYSNHILGCGNPRIGLLNNGEERTKGNELTIGAYALFEQSDLNFIGNVEGRDIFRGAADVVVCDGFVGNVLLKFGESIFGFITHQLRKKSSGSILRKLVAGLLKPVFREIKTEMSPENYGGAPLLGVDGISIICHGNSSPFAIENAVSVARQFVYEEVNPLIKNELSRKTVVSHEQ
jgi:phosphate acyltransferase